MPRPLPETITDPELSILLVGIGGTGRQWLAGLTGAGLSGLGLRLAGVCDSDPAQAAAALAEAGADLPVFASIAEALHLNPDIVIDCTTVNARTAIVGAALRHGAHVLCETPLVASDAEAKRLLGMAARARGHLAVSQNCRFRPGVRQMRALVRDGALGRPQRLTTTLHMAPRITDIRIRMRHILLRDRAIHAFDAARTILSQEAVSVICVTRQAEASRFAHGADIWALFDMSGGAQFRFEGSWTDPGPPTGWNGRWRLALTGGSATWDGETAARAHAAAPVDRAGLLPAPAAYPLTPVPEAPGDGILAPLAAFVAALRAGTAPETGVRDNVRSLSMLLAAIRSADADGRREPVTDLALFGDSSDFPLRAPPARNPHQAY